MTKEMPDEIWLDPDNCSYFEGAGRRGGKPMCVKYIRADLVPQWQDISTAPKDKRIIGAWKDGKWCAAELWFDDQVEEWVHASGDYCCYPTHWMPLPCD